MPRRADELFAWHEPGDQDGDGVALCAWISWEASVQARAEVDQFKELVDWIPSRSGRCIWYDQDSRARWPLGRAPDAVLRHISLYEIGLP